MDFFTHTLTPLAVVYSDLTPGLQGNVWELILHAGPVVKGVMLILLLLSVCSWGITLFKFLVFRSAIKESETFLNIFWERTKLSAIFEEAKTLQHSPLAEVFRSGYIELQKAVKRRKSSQTAASAQTDDPDISPFRVSGIGNIKRALEQAATAEQGRLEKNLTFLATTGSTAPFIGLFGTVWGIMDSFQQIGVSGSTNLATVAPGISEALIATAFGLVAAIPAVIAYNYYLSKINMISSEMENFSSEFLNIIESFISRQ